MLTRDSVRKNEILRNFHHHLSFHIQDYRRCFQSETADGQELGKEYILGLVKTEAGKRNMERINEELELSGDGYQRVQQFITDSTWSAAGLMSEIALNTSRFYAEQRDGRGQDVGYIIDESAHIKKGRHSVGVARQYAGVRGKVENCQVGVYVSLVWDTQSTLINARLFLPKCWTSDAKRCDKAGIPEDRRAFQTKLELALDMVKADREAGVAFSWVGGDGLYGHGLELGNALNDMGLTFLLDVHCNQFIYTAKPNLQTPERRSTRGARPTKPRADADPIRVDSYAKQLLPQEWQTVAVRNGTKGPLMLSVHNARVWLWDDASDALIERTLVMSRNPKDNKIKYSLSNANYFDTSIHRLAYMQAQRYWVERAFQEAKSELGMSDYQVRKWNAWHHHMALVMLALAFIVKERVLYKDDCPLLSCRDIRLMIISTLVNDPAAVDKRIEQMEIRHTQRRKDIERYYKPNAHA